MKSIITRSLLAASLLCGSMDTFAQANSWVLAPNVIFNANTGVASNLPAGSAITSCGGVWQRYNVVSHSSGSPYFAFSFNCGIFNNSGTSIGTGSYSNVFAIPGKCKRYYSVTWEGVWGPPHGNKLVLREIDASDPNNLVEVNAIDLINDGYMHAGAGVVVSSLQNDGTHRIYASSDTYIKRWIVYANGSVSSAANVINMGQEADIRLPLELTPDGGTLFYQSLSHNLMKLNVSTGTATLLHSFGGLIVSGMEYVPTNNRLYVSYHTWNGAAVGGFGYIDVASPAGITNALGSYPVPYAFGFTEIERARNGKLYFAYNPNYAPSGSGYYTVSSAGTLFSLDPATGTLAQVSIGSTPVSVTTYEGNWGYAIQNQIDGENYNNSTSSSTPNASFNINGKAPFLVTDVPDVYLCNGGSVLLSGTVSSSNYSAYSIFVQKGSVTYSPTWPYMPTFTPSDGGQGWGPVTSSATSYTNINLSSIFWSYLPGYYDYIKVSFTVHGGCSSATTTYYFRLRSVNALVNYLMIGPVDPNTSTSVCNYLGPTEVGLQNRRTIYNTFPALAQPATLPTCVEGWMGAGSVGISKGSTVGTTASPTGYRITVDECLFYDSLIVYDSTLVGTTWVHDTLTVYDTLVCRKQVLNKYPASIPASSYPFSNKTTPLYYFSNSYDTIKNKYIYKVTVAMGTTECDTVRSYSYFKIIDGGPSGSANAPEGWRLNNNQGMTQQMNVFPNPAGDKVHVVWQGGPSNPEKATISFYDVTGRVTLRHEMDQYEGMNDVVVNTSSLIPGVYHYVLRTTGKEYQGKIVKQ